MPAPTASSHNSNITLRQLRAFAAAAQLHSMARAAQQLHITSSALSMLISSLEGELGVRLFERTTRALALTDAGRELLPTVQGVFEGLDVALERLRQSASRKAGRLSLATSPLLAATLVPVLLARLRERFADVRLDLLDLPVNEIAQAVRSGHADVGICTADMDHPDLRSTTLYQDRLVLCCRADHPLALRREVRWDELAGEPMAVLRRGAGLRTLVEQGFAQAGIALRAAHEVTQVQSAIGLVEAGLALSALPSYALASARSTQVLGVALTAPVIQRDIVALTLPARPLSACGEAFLALFREHLLQTAPQTEAPRTRVRSKKAQASAG